MARVVLVARRMNVAAVEQARVAAHIHRAERRALAARRPRNRVRALVRALLLDELARYRAEGVFPKNRDFPDRAMPYFVDAEGTRCAMAHLLEASGQAALVERIARERNNAFVKELEDEPELLAWLDAAGISVEEAAAIQPTYCDVPAANICGGSFQTMRAVDASGVLEVKPEDRGLGTVVAVYGDVQGLKVGDVVVGGGGWNIKTFLLPVPRAGFERTKASPKSTIPAGTPILGQGIAIDTNGVLQDSGEHPLSRDQVIAAVSKPTRAECQQYVASIDEWYGEHDEECEEATTVSACSVEHVGDFAAASPASVAILVALVSTIVARRIRSTQP